MLDKIVACKPKSIFDIVPSEMFQFDINTDYAQSGNCWEWSYALAKAIQPTSYIEIGTRFGYSFIPTLIGGGDNLKTALGIDLEEYGNNSEVEKNIKKYYSGACKWNLVHADSQQMSELPHFADLIYVDGCHTYDCKMHDLRLTIGHCKYVFIDDASYLVDVKRAIHDFIDEVGVDGWGKKSLIEWAAFIPCFRGAYLIKYNI
jgi:hypothetical protein